MYHSKIYTLYIHFSENFWGTFPPNLSLARLAKDMRCLLWKLLKFKMVIIEAIAQGATEWIFLLAPT